MKYYVSISLISIFAIFIISYFINEKNSNYIYIYSSRKEGLTRQIFNDFTKDTGIKVKLLHDSDAGKLISRIVAEDENCEGDLLMTADVVNLIKAKNKGILKPIPYTNVNKSLKSRFKDKNNYWIGLTKRARIIIYSKSRVSAEELEQLNTYEDLENHIWKGRLLMRSSNHAYSQSLLSSIIAARGKERATKWVRGMVNNMPRAPQGSDSDQIRSIYAGEGDISVINTYYLARMLNSNDKQEVNIANSVGVIMPNTKNRGTHVNVSGCAILKHSKNNEAVKKMLNFLISDKAQKVYASYNQEYPIINDIPCSDILNNMGDLKEDKLPLDELEKHIGDAVMISDTEGWR